MRIETSHANDPAIRKAILDLLIAYNDAQTGDDTPAKPLALLLRGPDGAVQGGLIGVSYWDWLHVDLLSLPEGLRGGGLGARLMQAAENEAVRRGCAGVWLDTADYQAPGFYQKLGFRIFGSLSDYPPPHSRHWLVKTDIATRPVDLSGVEVEVDKDPADTDRKAVLDTLIAFNDAACGPSNQEWTAFVLRDEAGAPEGGMWTRNGRGWMFVELLGLPEHARGRGIGTELMRMAEDHARARGYRGMWLDTSSFQARPFYEKLGFEVFGQIDGQPVGHTRYFLSKRWDR